MPHWSPEELPDAVRLGALPLTFQDYRIPDEPSERPPLPSYPPGQSVNFFRELFFAGFPCAAPHEASYRNVAGGPAAVADRVLYSPRALLKVFSQYGTVVGFMYDEYRGMGCITYAKGEDAESCFLSMNNAIVPGPIGDPTTKDLQMVDEIGAGGFEVGDISAAARRGARDYVITCDFARCMPFVSPFLLLKDDFSSLDLSRRLLRNFPVPDAAADVRLAERPCAAWVPTAWVSSAATTAKGMACAATKEVAVKATATAAPVTKDADCIFVGPVFDDGPVDSDNPLYRAAYALLKPTSFTKHAGCGLPRLKLWWEYYNLYVLNKTEPTQDRIAHKRDFLAASCATVTQEVRGLCKDAERRNQRVEQASPHSLLRRLVYDDVYLCTLNGVILRQKFRLDAAFVSFMRDLYTKKVAAAFAAYRGRIPLESDAHAMRMRLLAQRSMEQANRHNDETTSMDTSKSKRDPSALAAGGVVSKEDDAADSAYAANPKVQAWFSMPLLEVAANVVTNVKHLRRIKKGEIGPDGNDRAVPLKDPTTEDLGYPGMTVKQSDADLYDEITTNLNGFCGDGSLFSLMLLAEDPAVFRCEPGHLGYEEAKQYHTKHTRSFWRDAKDIGKALIVPIIFITCIVMLINYVTRVAPEEDVTGAVRSGDAARRHRHTGNAESKAGEVRHRQRGQDGKEKGAGGGGLPDLETLVNGAKLDPAALADRRRQAARAATDAMQKAKEAAAKRGARFNIELSADL